MANEIKTVFQVNTGNSEKTIKQLKDEIKQLKGELENATIGTEAFSQKSKELSDAQDELKQALNITKQSVEDAEGSYNALVKQMAELKKEWKATADEAKRNSLGKEIDNINNQLKELDASIGNNQRNVGNYKGDVVAALQEIGTNTKSYSEQWGEVQKATEQTRAKFESVAKVASGLASGFAAVQGATALLGIENENLEKTFLKVQSAMAIAQGVGGMKDLIEGFSQAKTAFQGASLGVKAFITGLHGIKAAIVSTGIGALVVGVGMLIAYWDDLVELFGDGEDEIKKVKDQTIELQNTLKNNDDKNNFLVRLAEAAGKSKKEIIALRKEMALAQLQIAADGLREAKETAARLEREKKSSKEIEAANAAVVKAREEYFKREQEFYDIEEDRIVHNVEVKRKAAEDAKTIAAEQAAEEKRLKEEQHNLALQIDEEAKQSLIDTQSEELNALRIAYEKKKAILLAEGMDIKNLEAAYGISIDNIIKKYEAINAKPLIDGYNKATDAIDTETGFKQQEVEVKYSYTDTDNPVEKIELEIAKEQELEQIRRDAHTQRLKEIDELLQSQTISDEEHKRLEEEKARLIRQNAIDEEKYIKKLTKLEQDQTKTKKQLLMLQANATVETTSNTLKAVAGLMEEGSKGQKGIATAAAIMDTYKAANAAYSAMAGIFGIGPVLGAMAAAAAIAAGIKNVQAIWATDETGKNVNPTAETTTSASVTPAINLNEALPIEYTRNIMTDTETQEMNTNNKVYVVESDITETQNNVNVKETNSSF